MFFRLEVIALFVFGVSLAAAAPAPQVHSDLYVLCEDSSGHQSENRISCPDGTTQV